MPGDRTLLEHGGYCALGMDALVTVSDRRLSEDKRYHALGMDALVSVGSWKKNTMLQVCMLW